jgi:hypothetical protein
MTGRFRLKKMYKSRGAPFISLGKPERSPGFVHALRPF